MYTFSKLYYIYVEDNEIKTTSLFWQYELFENDNIVKSTEI